MKSNKVISGPCLPHCYSDERIIYLVIGFILGIIAYTIVDRILLKPNEVEIKNEESEMKNEENIEKL